MAETVTGDSARHRPASVLVLRAGALGDFLLGVPALRGLRRRFPGVEISVVAPIPQARVALWDGLADRVVDFGEPALAPIVAGTASDWPAVLPRPDVAVVWQRDHAAVSETLRRLGVRTTLECAPLDAIGARRHVAEWLMASLEPLGVRGEMGAGTLRAPAREGPAISGAEIVLHPGSGSVRKNWRGWREVVAALGSKRIAVVGGPADADVVTDLVSSWPDGVAPPTVLCDLSLEVLAGVLGAVRLYLGNDSGVSHLAAALGAPSVVVFGPTDAEVWRPIGPRVVTLGGTRVEEGIFAAQAAWPEVSEVVAAARAQLE